MKWLELLSALRYVVDAVRKIVAQIKIYAKKRRLQKELEAKDDATTTRELDRIL